MVNRFPSKILPFLMLLFSPIAELVAQEGNIKFTHLTINEGLLHNRVFDILQYKDGFIWMG